MSESGSRVAAVLVAAGTGERLGTSVSVPKALVDVGGVTLLEHALSRLLDAEVIEEIVVAHTPGHRDAFAAIVGERATLVEGGATRTDSVRRAVAALTDAVTVIAVHDAARALTPPTVIADAIAAVHGDTIAAAPGTPVADTLKRVEDGRVQATVSREDLWAVHTPQVVRADVLRTALDHDRGDGATDDLGLVERAREAGLVQGDIRLVEGHPLDLKVTFPGDIAQAEAALRTAT